MRKRASFFCLCWIVAVLTTAGCATSKVDWNNRIGNYTFDQAVLELGPPEHSAKLSDGRTVSEWLTYRGGRTPHFAHYSPGLGGYWFHDDFPVSDRFLRLTFSPAGRLESWRKISK